jgi:hypothetical protein
LEAEPAVVEELARHKGSLNAVAQEIYQSQQVVLEFMDKGMKGLLTGDLSVYLI